VRGTDVAGVVEAVGKNVADLEPGDEVFGSSWADTLATPGTFAQFTVVPASKLIKEAGRTHLRGGRSIRHVGPDRADRHPRPGQDRRGNPGLINGASGGVGTFAVQIAKALGAEVTGVCSTSNLELVRSLGADHVIDYTEEPSPAASSATTSSTTMS
jgi:NADPH:quinone reductase-like Zn-dependent oxidoreductase